jgi:triphosphoribosyl-dephospho-CoA synthase
MLINLFLDQVPQVQFPLLQNDKAKHISKCLELAILFEVTSSKPGNVNLVAEFEDTKIEHFLASAVGASATFEKGAANGIAISNEKLNIENANAGELIKKCVIDINSWQNGGNTLLGTVMLFVPLAIAAGMTEVSLKDKFNLQMIRKNLKLVVESTTALDAVNTYEAIDIAKPSGLNQAPDLDVNSKKSKERLLKENVSLFKVFQIAARYDDICYEWVNNFPLTFDKTYTYMIEQLKTQTLNKAIVHSFLKLLSERPDTFISRKAGVEKANEVSKEALKVLQLGGLETREGKESMLEFDKFLRSSGNNLNPGTTADITAAALALCNLNGYRP